MASMPQSKDWTDEQVKIHPFVFYKKSILPSRLGTILE